MNSKTVRSGNGLRSMNLIKRIVKQRFYQSILIIMAVWAIMFCYVPIIGNIIAFKNYKINLGFFGSSWVGLTHFKNFFQNRMTLLLLRNDFVISLLSLFFGTLSAIIFAISINELKNQFFKKSVQTVSYLPYFISMAVCANIWIQFLSNGGPLNDILLILGIIKERIPFLQAGSWYWPIVTAQSIWKNVGWNSIIYIAAIAGISQDIYEAARVDGAGRFRQIWHVTLPGILPTICILLIMNCGALLRSSFEQQLLMQNSMVMDYAEVIGTYVYKIGLGKMQYSYATAINLFQSVTSIILVSIANQISKKLAHIGLW